MRHTVASDPTEPNTTGWARNAARSRQTGRAVGERRAPSARACARRRDDAAAHQPSRARQPAAQTPTDLRSPRATRCPRATPARHRRRSPSAVESACYLDPWKRPPNPRVDRCVATTIIPGRRAFSCDRQTPLRKIRARSWARATVARGAVRRRRMRHKQPIIALQHTPWSDSIVLRSAARNAQFHRDALPGRGACRAGLVRSLDEIVDDVSLRAVPSTRRCPPVGTPWNGRNRGSAVPSTSGCTRCTAAPHRSAPHVPLRTRCGSAIWPRTIDTRSAWPAASAASALAGVPTVALRLHSCVADHVLQRSGERFAVSTRIQRCRHQLVEVEVAARAAGDAVDQLTLVVPGDDPCTSASPSDAGDSGSTLTAKPDDELFAARPADTLQDLATEPQPVLQ